MNDEKYLLDWYSNHIWSRPKPSKVCDGVGSFAIRDIPKGTSIYDLADKTVSAWISWSKVSTLPIGVVGCIYDTQPQMGTITNPTDFGWEHAYGPLWVYTTKGLNWQTNWFSKIIQIIQMLMYFQRIIQEFLNLSQIGI